MSRGVLAAFMAAFVFTIDAQGDEAASGDGAGGDSGDKNPLTPLLISIIAVIAVFAVVIVVLTLAIVIMCQRHSRSRRVHIRSRESNTYRAFSQERTQSPTESTVIIDPLARPSSTRSTRSHSHLLTSSPHSPLSPTSLVTTTVSTSVPHPRSLSTSAMERGHTYNHLRQHEGMQPLPLDYPLHEYSRLGPRPETPPLRPPKPAHLRQDVVPEDLNTAPQSNLDPTVSATNSAPLSGGHDLSATNPAHSSSVSATNPAHSTVSHDLAAALATSHAHSTGGHDLSTTNSAHSSGGHNLATTNPALSSTNPTHFSGGHDLSSVCAGVPTRDSVQSTERDDTSQGGGGVRGSGSDEVFVRGSIYDTMTSEGLRTVVQGRTSGEGGVHVVSHAAPSNADNRRGRDYDNLAATQQHTVPSTSVATPTTVSVSSSTGSRKQKKSSVKIIDDPAYSPFPTQPDSQPQPDPATPSPSSPAGRTRSSSVKVVDPRYVGDYERHPGFVPPQIEIPRDQLREKYRGDYERDPTYFTRNPIRSFSVSAASGAATNQEKTREHRSSLSLDPPVADKYRGDYERSEDYFLPPRPPELNGDPGTEMGAYVLEPDPSYAGEYERHPDYVPPLVKRSSKTRIHILIADPVPNGSSPAVSERVSHVPHEYTSLAAATKDPPRQYATLKSDLSPLRTLPNSTLKDSMV